MRRASRLALGTLPVRHQAPPPRRHRWLRGLIALAFLGVLAAILIVALVSTLMLDVIRSAPNISSLPARDPGRTTFIYDRHGRLIATLHGATDRIVVAGERIPRWLKQATVAIEDERFYQHGALDYEGIARAAVANFHAGRIVQGGSTISQQYIKNVYLGDDQSLARKVEEALLAYQLEARWSKDRILTAYLNTVYYGQGAYGVQAAAQTYFHRNVWQLSLAQCAQLAALPRDPTAYSPLYAPEAARARRNLVLSRMAREGYISAVQRRRAATASPRVYASAPAHHTADTAYFLDYLTQELTRRYGTRAVFEGGLRVYSSLDLRMQRAALKVLRDTLPPGPAGALVSIAARSGYIRAMATTADPKVSKFNLATQSRRQLGSAMKPFALAAAVAQGADPQSTYYVSAPQHLYLGPDQEPAYWDVATYSHTYSGSIDLAQATWQSDNTVYAQLAMDLGPDRIASVARRMGITSPIPALPSIVLGTASVNPLEVAVAYATLANGGVRHKPEAIERVKFPDGSVEATHRSGKRVLPAGVAYVVDRILQDNTRYGTAAAISYYYAGVAAGKTGTTSDEVDAWFAGFNPLLATAVWMGYPRTQVSMPGVQGATYCVPIWGKYYAMVFGSRPVPDFAVPARLPEWKPWYGPRSLNSVQTPVISDDPVTPTDSPSVPVPAATPTATQ